MSLKQYYDREGSALSYYEIKSFQLSQPISEKKVAQLTMTDADGYLKGEAQSLEAKTCQELGKLFFGKIPRALKDLKVRPEQLQRFQKGKC